MVLGLGTITLHTGLVSPTIAVYNNVAKQVLFKIGALLLQVAILKLCALVASSRRAFTSYLMFNEDYIQKTLYIVSRGFSSGGIILLILTLLILVGTWFDALLWALDSPGYLVQKSNVTAASIADLLLPEPGYLVFSSSDPGDVAPLDARLTDLMGANLFQPGVNFTLTGNVTLGTPKTVAATRPFEEVGPRIWLDSDGFSISADTYITIAANLSDTRKSFICPWKTISDYSQAWNCTFDNFFALRLASENILGRPEIHWDDVTDQRLDTQYISPTREDNPWKSLGTGGDTALMRQMFTVTKDRMRHTFLGSAFKTCLLSHWDIPLDLEQVTDLVKRSWSTNPYDQSHPYIYQVANSVINARSQNKSGVFGQTFQTETSVAQINYELLNVEGVADDVVYSLFRVSVVNITLVHSDELPEPAVPLEPCDDFYANIALGGRVRETDCYYSSMDSFSRDGHRFWGQIDTSAFLILNGILGQTPSNYSEKALNQEAFEWVVENDEKLSNLVLSRGAILGLSPASVMVEISGLQPAISRLQILLIAICALLAGVGWLCLIFFAKPHYSSSLLANLIATTMVISDGDESRGGKPRYLVHCPEIMLLHENNSRAAMATATGAFRYVSFEEASVSEHLISENVKADGKDGLSAKTTTVSEYEVK